MIPVILCKPHVSRRFNRIASWSRARASRLCWRAPARATRWHRV